MATLEELSTRLLKSAKDLADWNFPFSEVLEEYYGLLEAQPEANLNKAALVLQNSANAYVRRVEYLFQDTTSLIQTFVDQEAERASEKNAKKDGKEKKTVIDTIDFEPIDFSQYIAKNHNIKNRNGLNSSVKLLGQRFPQLENSSRSPATTDKENSNEGNPEQEKDIGRKYAFRCNEYITSSGMLVKHLTPEEFSGGVSSDQAIILSAELPESCDDSNADDDHREVAAHMDFGGVSDAQRCVGSTPFLDTEGDLMNTSFCSAVDSGRGSSLRTTFRAESSLSIDPDGNWDSVLPRSCSRLSSGESNRLGEAINDAGFGSDETTPNDTSMSGEAAADEHQISDDRTERVAIVEQCRRSKRLRSLFDVVKTRDSRPLEPIPFERVQDELPRSRAEFKLPCAISLLKCSEKSRKRKIHSETRKRRCLEKLMNESEMRNKKMTMYSPTRQILFPFMKEELDYLPKCLNKYLQNLRDPEALNHYEAVTNESAQLLGYKSRDRKPDTLDYEPARDTDETTTTTEMTESVDDFPMPDTPESCNSPDRLSPPPLTFTSTIDQLVNDIYESADVRTEQEEAVARWHENIRSKLEEAEQRPKFEMAEYTGRVMKSLRENRGRLSFERMIRENEPPEPARYLLASLMLANKYNVHIDTSEGEGNVTLLLLKD